MPNSLKFKCHEWLADHCAWVQYPRISGGKPLLQWRYAMNPWMRFDIALASIAGILVFGILFAAIALTSYLLIAS